MFSRGTLPRVVTGITTIDFPVSKLGHGMLGGDGRAFLAPWRASKIGKLGGENALYWDSGSVQCSGGVDFLPSDLAKVA